MRGDDESHSRKVRFFPFELDLKTGELCKHRQRIRLQRQPFQILSALLAKPGEIVSREELRERLWPGNVFLDYEHGLNRSINKLRCALADNPRKPRYIETVHGRGYRFIAAVDDDSVPREARLAVLPVENVTGLVENEDLAERVTEAVIDGLSSSAGRLCVIALASVERYRKKRAAVERVAADLCVDYLVYGRLRSEDSRFLLRLELVDTRDRTLRWANSFDFLRDSLPLIQNEIVEQIAARMEPDMRASNDMVLDPTGA